MNLYRCHLNTGHDYLDEVTPIIAAETRGKAKAILLAAVNDAGWDYDWTTPVSVCLEAKDASMSAGVVRYA